MKRRLRSRLSKRVAAFILSLSLVFTLTSCYRVDVPTLGDNKMRKAQQKPVEVKEEVQEKIPVEIRYSPQEVSKKNSQTETKGAWEMWPAAASVPVHVDVDMAAFNQRNLKNKPLTDAVVFLDPTHGSTLDLGSSGEADGKSFIEANITISLANKLKVVLENMGAKVILLRENNDWRSLHARIAAAGDYAIEAIKPHLDKIQADGKWLEELASGTEEMKERNNDRQDLPKEKSGMGMAWGYGVSPKMRQLLDLEAQFRQVILLSLNMSASSQLEKSNQGFETYYLTSDFIFEKELKDMGGKPESNGNFAFAAKERANPSYYYKNDKERQSLAANIYDAVASKITYFARTADASAHVGQANYTSLRETGYVSAALQCGFISNEDDLRWIADEDNQNTLVQAIGLGVYNYYCMSSWPQIEGLSRSNDGNWKLASDAYREKAAAKADKVKAKNKKSAEPKK